MRVLLPWKTKSPSEQPPHADDENEPQQQEEQEPSSSLQPKRKLDSKPSPMTAGFKKRALDGDEEEEDEKPHALVLENEPYDSWYGASSTVRRIHQEAAATAAAASRNEDDEEEPERPAVDSETNNDENVQFAVALKRRGLEIVEQEGDGNCLFRAVALQVYGDANAHLDVRQQCMDYMSADPEHFSAFINEDFKDYIERKRTPGAHGNNPELQALSELFNRPLEVFTPQGRDKPINIFHAEYKTNDAPIRLSYHDGNHYNAVIDPYLPTAGLGLGLPGLQPGLADKMQVAKAVTESDKLADEMEFQKALEDSQDDELRRVLNNSKQEEEDALQRALKESTYSMDHLYQHKAIALSDLDATNFELEQTALEKSLEVYRQQEQGRKQRAREVGQRRPRPEAAASIPAAASLPETVPSVASAASARRQPSPTNESSGMMYPQVVQELVMNGFELSKVVHAYELIGDNFDDLLSFLMMNASR